MMIAQLVSRGSALVALAVLTAVMAACSSNTTPDSASDGAAGDVNVDSAPNTACDPSCSTGTHCDKGKCVPDDVSGALLTVQGGSKVTEGKALRFVVKVAKSALARQLGVRFLSSFADPSLSAEERSMHEKLFVPGHYVANGTVFTRSVADMPIADNSAKIAAYAPTMPAQYVSEQFKSWLKTSLNTSLYNIPIYVVDSTNDKQAVASFASDDPRVIHRPDLVSLTTGSIPFPPYATPNAIGDYALSIYDRGTGLMREYFYVVKQPDNSWRFSASGYYQAEPAFEGLPQNNFFMQLTRGSSAVVGMLNPLSQIGIDEARSGVINHALSVTFPNAAKGITSFPAQQNDGTDPHPDAPAQGQWFRIDPKVDLATLGLKPFTRMIAHAIQTYGGYGADKNLWCFAFNTEHPANEIARGKPDPWGKDGDIPSKFGGLDVNDFPWHLTQWATLGWNGKATDAGVYAPPHTAIAEIHGAKQSLTFDAKNRIEIPAGIDEIVVTVQTAADSFDEPPEYVTLEASLYEGQNALANASGEGVVLDE